MAEETKIRTTSQATIELFPAKQTSRRKGVFLMGLALTLIGGGAYFAYNYSQLLDPPYNLR